MPVRIFVDIIFLVFVVISFTHVELTDEGLILLFFCTCIFGGLTTYNEVSLVTPTNRRSRDGMPNIFRWSSVRKIEVGHGKEGRVRLTAHRRIFGTAANCEIELTTAELHRLTGVIHQHSGLTVEVEPGVLPKA